MSHRSHISLACLARPHPPIHPPSLSLAHPPTRPPARTARQHIARAIGEEVDLQAALLDDLDDGVDVTHSRLRAAVAKMKAVAGRSSNVRGGLLLFLAIIALTTVVVIAFKLS